jgi:hypothetical protein
VKAFKPAQLSTPILVVLHFQPSAAPRPNAAVAAHSCTLTTTTILDETYRVPELSRSHQIRKLWIVYVTL